MTLKASYRLDWNTKYRGGRFGADPLREPANVNLTLDGWQQYDPDKSARSFEANHGFIADAVRQR